MTSVGLVLDREVEPLVVAASVCVDAHVKRELARVGLDHHIEVARLEVAVEDVGLTPKIGLSEPCV